MRKILNILFCLVVVCSMTACAGFDDGSLKDRIDNIKERLAILQTQADNLEKQLKDLSYITNGNVVTSVTKNADGKYVITYKDNANNESAVIIATMSEMTTVPVVGVAIENGVYYWTKNTNGTSGWLLDKDGQKIPVSGHTPVLGVDNNGNWTVDGNVLTDENGQPVEAHDAETSLFKVVKKDAEGNLMITLGDGTTITLPVIDGLNLHLETTPIVNLTSLDKISFNYELLGEKASYALVDIARAENVTASINKQTKTIEVSFPAGFKEGNIIVMAYDLENKTILRPVYFQTPNEGGDESDVVKISSAKDLVDFASNVNAGSAQMANAELTQDIDMSSVTDWTPIGNGSFTWASNELTVNGSSFKGTFDGKGFAIRNLKLIVPASVSKNAYGLFGVLDGATVKNLTIGAASSDNSELTVSSSSSIDVGVIAGLCNESTIENCTSYVPMNYNGKASSRVTMAMVGFVFCKDTQSMLNELKNFGTIKATTTGNSNNGATSIQVAGIAGFSTNDVNSKICNLISYCTNNGAMESQAPRTSGILAAANRYTTLVSCVNNANQMNSCPNSGSGRLGNITCITGTGTTMSDCINYGNLVSTTSARCGGLVSLVNHATNIFDGCSNFGEVITDDVNRGAFWAYNNLATTWIGCNAGGKVGAYNGGTYLYDSYPNENVVAYLGKQGTTNQPILTNITYSIAGQEEAGTSVTPTLKILFIGNSFTKDAVEYLPKLLEGAGINSVQMVHMYYGGRTIPEYNDGFSTLSDYTCYKCKAGWNTWGAYSGYKLEDVVKSDDWDIVTIQEHTGRSDAWNWTDTEKAAINGLVAKIKANQTKTPRLVYILSQAYASPTVLSDYGQINVLKSNFSSQEAMYTAIINQGKKVQSECGLEIIATGTMLQNLRTSSINNEMDLTRDGYHMDFGITRYAAACAMFESLISPNFGNKKLDDNTYRSTASNTASGSYTTPIDDSNRLIALQAARYALQNPFEVTNMAASGVRRR